MPDWPMLCLTRDRGAQGPGLKYFFLGLVLFQAVSRDLDENESVLEAVNVEAFQLLQELKLVDGLVDTEGVEEQLRLVNQRWNEAKLQVLYYILFLSSWKIKDDASILCNSEFRA